MRSCQKTIAPKKRGEVFNLIQKRGKRKKPENRANTRFKGISGSVGGNVYFDPWIDQKSRRSVQKNTGGFKYEVQHGLMRGGFKYEVQHGLMRRKTPRGVS